MPDGMLSGECFSAVLDAMTEAVFVADNDRRIIFANVASEVLSGIPLNEIRGQRICDVIKCDVKKSECDLPYTGQIREGVQCTVRNSKGLDLHVVRNVRPIRKDGQSIGFVETLTDITDFLKTREKLAQVSSGQIDVPELRHGMVGSSSLMDEIHELIDLAAASNVTILVSGETGTGKELVAKAIHTGSARSGGPFVKVNCSSLNENLLESELFGHVRGAFTGAIKDKVGRFEAVNGGTLFLDEIGEISPLIQVKLLRFLQEHEFERVGDGTTRISDVRIIAATHRDLREMVRLGEFREDLFYRLKVFPIHMPPLRERKEDVGYLATHFIAKFNSQIGKNIPGFDRDAAIVLMDYCWPGNIRELEHAIEHAFVTCRAGEMIGLFDLPVEIRKMELRTGICRASTDTVISLGKFSGNSGSRQEMIDLLRRFDWNRNAVANALGIDRSTLWRRMRKLGISGEN